MEQYPSANESPLPVRRNISLPILSSILLTSLITGTAVYSMQKRQNEQARGELEDQISSLREDLNDAKKAAAVSPAASPTPAAVTTPAPAPAPAPKPVAAPDVYAGWETYANTAQGISIRYPDGWYAQTQSPDENTDSTIFAIISNYDPENVLETHLDATQFKGMVSYKSQTSSSVEAYADTYVQEQIQGNKSRVASRQSITTAEGVKGVIIKMSIATEDGLNRPADGYVFLPVSNNKVLEFSVFGPMDNLEAIAKSIDFTK